MSVPDVATDSHESTVWMPASALLDAYRSRRLSPVEVIREVLDRLERLQPTLNAFCLVDAEAALAAARESERRWTRGEPAGLLDGVPVSIKDIVLTRGWPTLRGSRTTDPAQDWSVDAPAVARLREENAILFGKTTTSEFAFKGVTDNPLTGITRNPWNPDLTPGGSSGGAAAAVAAGIGPIAIGTDAGGSIRTPSSLCGLFGHKPSGGRVAMFPPTPYATLAGFGPMTRTVECAALVLSAIARPDPRDWEAMPDAPPAYHRHLDADPRNWRIAWSPSLGYTQVAPEVAGITAAAAQTFAELGARVETVERVLDDPWPTLDRLKRGLTAYAFRNFTEQQFALMDPMLVEEIRASRSAALTDHLDAQMERGAVARAMLAFHRDYDLLLTPTLPVPAFPVGRNTPEGHQNRSWCGLLYPFNLTRQPAATVPCGFTADGLPVGLQIVGRPDADLAVLQAARAFETARPWAQHRPRLAA